MSTFGRSAWGRRAASWVVAAALLAVVAGVSSCETFRSAEHHLARVEAQLEAGEPAAALAHLERRGLIATVAGREQALRALLALDRVAEAVELLHSAEGRAAEALWVEVCEAGLAEALRRGDRPSQVRVVESCGALAEVQEPGEGLLTELGLFRLAVLEGEMPDYGTRRGHLAAAAEDGELAEALAEGYAHLGEVLERTDLRATALRMRWSLAPSAELGEELVERFAAEARAALEEAPHEAITWFEHLTRDGRVPGLEVPEALRAEAAETIAVVSLELATEGAISHWERRRRARDEAEGIWDAEAEAFVFPAEDLEARRERFSRWMVDRANWPDVDYTGLDVLGQAGVCRDPAEECRVPVRQFAGWAIRFEDFARGGGEED